MALLAEYTYALGLRALVARHLPRPGSNRGYAPSVVVETVVLLLQTGGRTLEDLRELAREDALLALLSHDVIPEYQSGHQGRHILKGLTERVRAGYLVTAAPFGMRRDLVKIEAGRNGKSRLFSRAVPDDQTAHIPLEAFQRYDQGEGFKTIAQSFTARGYRTKTSKPFTVEGIRRRLLANAAYMGVLEYHVRGKFGAPDEVITVPGFYPQLVPEELFRRVQERLAANAANYRNSYAQRTPTF